MAYDDLPGKEPPPYNEDPTQPLPPPDESLPAPPPPSSQVDPWDTAPADGNWQSWFLANTQGRPPTPAELTALEAKLGKHGIKVLRNAAGVAGKIQLPGGQIVDVIEAAGLGGKAWQWLTDDGGAQGGQSSSMRPDEDWFASRMPGPDAFTNPERPTSLRDFSTPARPDYLQGEYRPPEWTETFTAPSMDDLQADPGYQARLAAAQKGFERSAAARGSILSGGSQIALGREQQNLAANEYGAAFGRAYDTYQQRYGQFQTNAALSAAGRQMNEGAYQSDVANAENRYRLGESAYQADVGNAQSQYDRRYRTYRDAIGDNFRLADYGFNATTAGRP